MLIKRNKVKHYHIKRTKAELESKQPVVLGAGEAEAQLDLPLPRRLYPPASEFQPLSIPLGQL